MRTFIPACLLPFASALLMAQTSISVGPPTIVPVPPNPVYFFSNDSPVPYLPSADGTTNMTFWVDGLNYRSFGKSFDTMGPITPKYSVLSGESRATPNWDHADWLQAVVRRDGVLYGFYHAEDYSCGDAYFWQTTGLAISTDDGASWVKKGKIVGTTNPCGRSGGHEMLATVWDHLNNRWMGWCHQGEADVSYAADAAPGTWLAWDGTDFNTPMPGDGPVGRLPGLPGNIASCAVAWNTYLEQWVMIYHTWGGYTLYATFSPDGVTWSTPQVMFTPDPNGSTNRTLAYPMWIGTRADWIGQDCRLAYISLPSNEPGRRSDIIERWVHFGPLNAPVVPANLTARGVGTFGTSIVVSWDASPMTDNYLVFRSDDGGGSYSQVTSMATSASFPTYTDTNVVLGQTHYYKVQATNTLGASTLSSAVSASPAAPGADGVISVNMVGNSSYTMGATESAGAVVVAQNWNNAPGGSGTLSDLKYGAGAGSGTNITWSSPNAYGIGLSYIPGDSAMMNGYLDGASPSVTVSNIPAAFVNSGYSVYVYCDGTSKIGRISSYTIGATTIQATDTANFLDGHAFVFTKASNSAGNYVVFDGLASSQFTLVCQGVGGGDGTLRAPVNGIQVVANANPNPNQLTWDGTTNNWNTVHWLPGPVNFPSGNSSANEAVIASGTVAFNSSDLFGNWNTTSTPKVFLRGGTLKSRNNFNVLWNLQMSGGTLLADGGANTVAQAYQLAGTLDVTGTTPSRVDLVASGNNGLNKINVGGQGNNVLTLDVADVTGNADADLTIIPALQNYNGNGGKLVKTGPGTLWLSAANTYAGTTTIEDGALVGVVGGSCASSAVTVADGATIGVQVTAPDGQWTCAGLTHNAGNTYLDMNFTTVAPSTTTAPLRVNGNLAINGTLQTRVRNGNWAAAGTYPLVSYTGTLSGTVPASAFELPPGLTASLVNNTSEKRIDLMVSISLTWDGTTNNWNSAHWLPGNVTGPTTSSVDAFIPGGTVSFQSSDLFGDWVTTTSPRVVLSGGTLKSRNNFNVLWNLQMSGGTLLADGGANPPAQAFQLAGTLGVTGTTPSGIDLLASGNNGLNKINIGGTGNTTLTMDIADVTGDSAADLTVNPILQNWSSTAGALVKTGAGTLALNAVNTYTGNTTVTAGTLSLANACLADVSTVEIGASATLELNFTGSDSINQLIIDGIVQSGGSWGGLTSSAVHKTERIKGDGMLLVAVPPGYDAWAASFGVPSGSDAFDDDANGDGIANGLEWILGGSPLAANNSEALPRADVVGGNLEFTFERADDSAAVNLQAQWSANLLGWQSVPVGTSSTGPDANGVTVEVVPNASSPDAVTVKVPLDNATDERLFIRLHAKHPQPDSVFADFEGTTYGTWQTTGTAFGSGPAAGSLPGQQSVTGFNGSGLVNSFFNGDNTTGTLTSPAFTVQSDYISFLIGGGGWSGQTCINLLVNGQVARTATGAGSTETLISEGWDVTEFYGQSAVIQIVDQRTGSWGHVNVDHIVFTDVAPTMSLQREIQIDASFLQLPLMQRTVANAPEVAMFSIVDAGRVARTAHLEIAGANQVPDFTYSFNVSEFLGRSVTLRFRSTDPNALNRLVLSNQEFIDPQAYAGLHRPRFHFSPGLGWMNDINGTYYQDGLYHLFYQANPTTTAWSTGFDMHWGHSVSTDLVHWMERPVALYPDSSGECYSGSAVLLNERVPGVNDTQPLPTPALMFTTTGGGGQHLATSADAGETWRRFAGNPAIPYGSRDPKIFWHEPSQRFVTLLYVSATATEPEGYQILRSINLTTWEKTTIIENWNECPEFVQVTSAVTGQPLWLLYGSYNQVAAGQPTANLPSAYQLGTFDGAVFTPVSPVRKANQGGNFYAALTFVNAPANRNIMMAWARGTSFPGEPFNQCASLPLELTLRAYNGQDTLCMEPAVEINALRGTPLLSLENQSIAAANSQLAGLAKDAPIDVTLRFPSQSGTPVVVRIRNLSFTYDPATMTVGFGSQSAVIHPGTSVNARFLMDRGIVECFWNEGEASFATGALHTTSGPAFSIEGNATIEELVVYPMASIWNGGTP